MRSVLGSSSRPKTKVSTYNGSLNAEDLIDSMSDMGKYFEYEELDDEKKVKFVVKILKGHATLWWDSVHAERK